MQRVVRLPLYGAIKHGAASDMVWDLYQTHALARLRDISLSSVPSSFAPHGVATSRFQHSVAVAYLARTLCQRRRELADDALLLQAAGLLHDVGSPPFSHISEVFLYNLTGQTHEQQTQRLLAAGGELADLLDRFGVDPARVVELITGRDERLGPLIAGSIDLDNLSNTVDLLASLGYHDQVPYRPLDLVNAFVIRDGRVALDSAYLTGLLGWAKARRMLYGLLNSEPNRSAATMLYRATEAAYADGLLDETFFSMGESEALLFLRANGGQTTRVLLDEVARWRHYPLLYRSVSRREDPRLVGLYEDWRTRKAFADALAGELGVPAHELTFYVGRDRSHKPIRLPFVGADAAPAAELFTGRGVEQHVAVFAHKRHQHLDPRRVRDALSGLVGGLPVIDAADVHAFF